MRKVVGGCIGAEMRFVNEDGHGDERGSTNFVSGEEME